MCVFIVRTFLFSMVWIMMIFQASSQLLFSIFMLTTSIAFFFFLSTLNSRFFAYIILSILLFAHLILFQDILYTSILILLIVIIALFQVSTKEMYYLLAVNYLFVCVLIYYQENYKIAVILLGSLIVFLLIKSSQVVQERKEQKELYQQLLAEFRQLKRMHVSTEEIAKSEERTRIAREIHDSVGHRLTALMMKLEILYLEKSDESFLELKEMANKSLIETREAVQTLQESETKGITAVVQLIRKLEAESQLLIHFTLKEGVLSIPLTNQHGIVLYRVIQEALTNVMKHSISKQVHISIGKSAINTLAFTITNPINQKKKFKFGFGLKNMQARMAEIDGQLDIYQTTDEFVIQGMMAYDQGGESSVAGIDC